MVVVSREMNSLLTGAGAQMLKSHPDKLPKYGNCHVTVIR